MFRFNNKVSVLLTVAAAFAVSNGYARPSVNSLPKTQLRSAANCKEAQSSIDLDINNVRARLMTGGDMWWDRGTGTASYEIPKGSKKNSLFAGSCWIGGYDAQGQLKVAAQLYRADGNDYWPGPLNNVSSVEATTCSDWDRFWKVNRSDINKFRELVTTGGDVSDPIYDDIKYWPAYGNVKVLGNNGSLIQGALLSGREYAPYIDVDGDGKYNWENGDYPDIFGDQYIWWVFNDKGNIKGQTKSDAIGLEVQTTSFAYSTKDFLNDASFVNYRIINRGTLTMDSTFMGTWTDADLGLYTDDYIGCDTARGLGILYNAKSADGNGAAGQYGNTVPMIGVDFFRGPKRPLFQSDGSIIYEQLKMTSFTYFNNAATSDISDPQNGQEIFYYMTGSNRVGRHFRYDFQGPGIQSNAYGPGSDVNFVFWGEPNDPNSWSECSCNNAAGDRRFVHSGGPFKLLPGAANDITIGAVWVSDVGGCPNTTFQKIRTADDMAQELFDNNFQIIEGPQAPRLVIREMDRKLICYMINDPSSNNFREQYGYNLDSAKYRVISRKAAKVVRAADSLYKFEGYRVFQVKSAEVQAADIYDAQTGAVNTELAAEVFQCDISNGIVRIDNFVKDPEFSDTSWRSQIKVKGKDSGISHSFELTIDQFAAGAEKRLVNYKSYYYIAVAYAYNNFAPFNPSRNDSTQDIAYLESRTAAGGVPIPIVIAMPNPANGDMGTVVNAGYGDGVIIHRLEGKGNGAALISVDDATEQAILNNNRIDEIVYKQGEGPVDIKVIDPVKLAGGKWELFMRGPRQYVGSLVQNDSVLVADSTATWFVVKDGVDTVYSENAISLRPNEQILEKYGLSINVKQVGRTGVTQAENNGYITSDVTFADPNKPWLGGLADAEGVDVRNWIRAGGFTFVPTQQNPAPGDCNFDDNGFDVDQVYEKLFSNNANVKATWAPYSVIVAQNQNLIECNNFAMALLGSQTGMGNLHSVDLVLTSDKSKWTKCIVLEAQNQVSLSEHGVQQFFLRGHQSWTGEVDGNGLPVYSTVANDTGMSYFPGYAIDHVTGERLCIVFTEDSYLQYENGSDMIWNPTSAYVNYYPNPTFPTALYGGKHYTYITSTRYDQLENLKKVIANPAQSNLFTRRNAFGTFMWAGVPMLNDGYNLLPLKDNLIPTDVRLRFRVKYNYASTPDSLNAVKPGMPGYNNGNPHYSFSTTDIAPSPLSDASDKNALLERIHAVPNPYYGYAGYEINRLDTRVRIINLPKKATIDIYSLDGSLVRRLSKDNANASYIDWDIRNAKGLPIASGMYLIHVKAEGIGETVVKWFGAMRPLDVTQY